ncbi:endo alpha-1,4 polygalactosaminidase [Arthrobacter sp. H35-D1]|uniref:endo alpha-1,4 polygalactosaminidase n=1 Tax=Arthrobacter sp. H35-D1 TaxID=3046202 RepID=UPI0024B97A3C|nr:endo alpha-1,4 polygalactosaminidase [Arthrobacter sp. H35-D1]MDJ0313679.1 endo alpha-1,4 polygalactosaminidase [Arthrobacter sp. H35-D1]
MAAVAGAVAAAMSLAACAPATPSPATADWWTPQHGQSWQVQLSDALDTSVNADIYDVDGVDTAAPALRKLKDTGAHLVCYFNAGGWEEWREDAALFDPPLLGLDLDGWPGERWLDVRQQDELLPLMAARMDACKERGFDAVDPDNVDGYANDSGFALTKQHQLAYIRSLAGLAHERGLGFGLKNAPDLVAELVDDIDFAVNEQCHEYEECAAYAPLLASGKAVVDIEYETTPAQVCPSVPRGMEVLFKPLDLGAERTTC